MKDEASKHPPENFPRLRKSASPSVITQQVLNRAAEMLIATGLSRFTTGARRDRALDLLIADRLEAQAMAHENAAAASDQVDQRRLWARRLRVRSEALRSRS